MRGERQEHQRQQEKMPERGGRGPVGVEQENPEEGADQHREETADSAVRQSVGVELGLDNGCAHGDSCLLRRGGRAKPGLRCFYKTIRLQRLLIRKTPDKLEILAILTSLPS